MEELIAFNKKGDKVAMTEIPKLIYLNTRKEWIDNTLARRPELDGIALTINWETKEMKMARYAE